MSANCSSGHRRYSCNWTRNHHTGVEKRTCFEKAVRADALETDIWQEIEELFSDLDRLWRDLKAAQQAEIDQQEPKREELQAIEATIAQTERKGAGRTHTLRVLADTDRDGFVVKSPKKDVEETNQLHRDQLARRDKLLAELGTRVLTDDRITEIIRYARDVKRGIRNPDLHAKRRILNSLGVKVTVKDGHYHLKCVLGETS